MDDSRVQRGMSFELLRYVRDTRPTEEALLRWAEDRGLTGNVHLLRKGGVLQVTDGQVSISPERYTPDRSGASCGNGLYWLDKERIDIF